MTPIGWRAITGVVCLIVGGLFYKTHDLDGVENAWVYRLSYALMAVGGISFFAEEILGLW